MSEDLRISAVRVRPATAVSQDDADRGLRERLQLEVEVQADATKPLHVWTSRSAYDYDAATKTLTVYLAEPGTVHNPDIELISDHPRVPSQTTVAPGDKAILDVPIPTTIRRAVPSGGLGLGFVEEPIGSIEHVEVHVQYADVPFQHVVGETPDSHRKRLQSHGRTTSATLTPEHPKEP